MIEFFHTKQTVSGKEKMVNHLERIDEIRDDCWINMVAPTEEEIKLVEDTIQIPPEFLRYPLDEEERPRIDLDEDTGDVLIIIDIPCTRKDEANVRYETGPLGIIITRRHLLTVSLRQTSILDTFIENRVRDFIVNYRTRFAIQILLAVAKDYLKLLRYMDKSLESSERALAKSISNTDLYKMMELGKSLVYFSTSLKSNEAVLEKLMRGRVVKQYEDDEDLLEDVIIEYKQAREMADIYASIVNGTMDAYASIINNNMNLIMKILAAATIALSVPTVISSFFGQNVPMPWSDDFSTNSGPFFIVLALGCVGAFIAVYILRKKRML
ncbi:MAG: magnesium transporter CorA family protein [Clostridiaceae bacterium]|jgi:magnesium transporter|nr:magnesium transporter CorA family protein [Clostridiaceae bacterium]